MNALQIEQLLRRINIISMDDSTLYNACYAMAWSIDTGRYSGILCEKLHNMDNSELCQLLIQTQKNAEENTIHACKEALNQLLFV